MELGQYQLQIFVSLVVILVAAFVALICDFLKGNNDQLRELTIELRVRREEDQKRSHLLTPHAVERFERRESAPKIEEFAAPEERVAINKEKKRTVISEAHTAIDRGATLAGARTLPVSAPVAPVRTPESKVEMTRTETIRVTQSESGKPAPARIAIKTDWGSLLTRNAQGSKAEGKPTEILETVCITTSPVTAKEDLLAAVVAATNSSTSAHAAEQPLPSGFQDGFVLTKLVQSRQPVSGLVVSIGVNASGKSDGKLPESVQKLVQSLIGACDFAAQSGEDEFLLIFPQERGASAQRRLSQIAEQLWDFQLRSLGSFQILFSWGGVEVRSELLEEAIASASERMQDTKRGRKLFTMASCAPAAKTQLRKAV